MITDRGRGQAIDVQKDGDMGIPEILGGLILASVGIFWLLDEV